MTGRCRHRRRHAGTISLELVITAPVLLGVLSLVAAFGRFGGTESAVEQAARDAARAATQTQNETEAYDLANEIVDDTLQQSASTSCAEEHEVDITISSGEFEASDPYQTDELNMLTVTVTCIVDTSDLAFLPLGEIPIERSFTSPFDVFRAYYAS